MANLNQIAASAYGATQKLPTLPSLEAKTDDVSFSDLVEKAIDSFEGTQAKAEDMSIKAAQGKADINDVILAVQNADVALSAVVTIRDRIIQAYQDVLRMAI